MLHIPSVCNTLIQPMLIFLYFAFMIWIFHRHQTKLTNKSLNHRLEKKKLRSELIISISNLHKCKHEIANGVCITVITCDGLPLLLAGIGAGAGVAWAVCCWCSVIVADCFLWFYGIRNEIARMMMIFLRSLFIRRQAQKLNQTVSVTVKSEKSTDFMALNVKINSTIQVNVVSILRYATRPKYAYNLMEEKNGNVLFDFYHKRMIGLVGFWSMCNCALCIEQPFEMCCVQLWLCLNYDDETNTFIVNSN